MQATLKNQTHETIKVAVVAFLAFTVLFGCGARNSSSDLSSGNIGLGSTSGGTLAVCNAANSTLGDLSVQVSNTNNDPEFIRMKFASLPASFYTQPYGSFIRISAWTEDASGNVYPTSGQQLVGIKLQYTGNGSQSDVTGYAWNQSNLPPLAWDTIRDYPSSTSSSSSVGTDLWATEVSNYGAPSTSSQPAQFWTFNTLMIDLTPNGVYPSAALMWKVLRVEVVDYNNPTSNLEYVDILIPQFSLDPSVYQSANPYLAPLHPFYSLIGSSPTSTYLTNLDESYCF